MGKKLQIERKDENDKTLFTLKGIIDEEADFKEAFDALKTHVVVNFEGVDLINSCGVREWIHTTQRMPAAINLEFVKCAPRIVEQINYVSNFLGPGVVMSFYAPYFCHNCKKELNILLDVKDLSSAQPREAPSQVCPTCNQDLEFDDIEEEYFSFLEGKE